MSELDEENGKYHINSGIYVSKRFVVKAKVQRIICYNLYLGKGVSHEKNGLTYSYYCRITFS